MVVVSYDISNDKLRTKFAKYLSRFGHRLQYSVFEIDNSEKIVNALYLQLLEMQKEFIKCCEEQTLIHLPNSDEIKELQTDYVNMLTTIIDLLDGAKYLWEGEHHETK